MRASLIRHWIEKSKPSTAREKRHDTEYLSTGEESMAEQSAKQASLDSDGEAISS
jgi:hypothetical protein